ncbi:MAG: hypothetical protein HKN26_11535 [Acidimicrobiales bacterium]|nr:hypothetical protein [Acidimicrobiales bacterium]
MQVDASTLPANTTTPTGDRDGTLDGETTVVLSAAGAVSDADFAYQPLGSIGDTIYADDNGNGTQDGGEAGLAGVTVNLLDAGGSVIASIATDGSGTYNFSGLPAGDYTVQVDASTLPADTITPTGDPDGTIDGATNLTLGAGVDAIDTDFGFQPLGVIGDTIYADDDGNGTQNGGESGLSGVTVNLLDAGGTVIATEVTDGSGSYSFLDVPAGDYTVQVDGSTLPANTTTPSGDPDTTVDGETSLTLAPGETVADADFGFQPLATIGDLVFSDSDGGGTHDAGEPGIAGVTIDLLDAGGTVVATATTDGSGAYAFSGLTAGDYTVRIDAGTLPANVTTPTGDRDGTLDGETTVTVTVGEVVTDADFAYEPDPLTSTLGDTIYADVDGNGTQDVGEPGLAGVTVNLLDDGGTVVATATTAADGTYSFVGVLSGDYTVEVDTTTLPADTTTPTADPDPTLDGSHSLTVVGGVDQSDIDFGFQPLGTITASVFEDADGSGAQDAGESDLAGVSVDLVDAGGTVIATVVTDASGVVTFPDVPAGDYTLVVDPATVPAGSTLTADPDATLDGETAVTLLPGQDLDAGSFGYQPLGGIDSIVFEDADGNGTQDPGEPGIAGVTVDLLDGAGNPIASTVTGSDGGFSFADLPDGDYAIVVDSSTLPADTTTQTADPDAVLDGQTDVTVARAGQITGADFGYQPDAPPATGSVTSAVWVDANGDGVRDAGEDPLPGVTVDVIDAGGAVVATAVTAADGTVSFSGLPAGDYTLQIDAGTLPPGTTTQTADPDATLDGATAVTVTAGENTDAGEFGYEPDPVAPIGSIVGNIFADIDLDSVRDPGEPSIAGVELILFDENGVEIARTVTDVNGDYAFNDLPLGTYEIEVVPPAGWVLAAQSTADDGSDYGTNNRAVVILDSFGAPGVAIGGLQQVQQPATTTTTTAPAPPPAPPVTPTNPNTPPDLSYTGTSTGPLLLLALLFLVAGTALIVGARRHRFGER